MTYILRQFYAILRQLHWLPVRQRIIFKTAVLVYKCLHGMAPPYLSTYCEPTSSHGGRRHLRSAESGQLIVPRTRTNYGDRSFAVYGPVVWNSLPTKFRLLDISLPVFRKRWKCSCSRITVTMQQLTRRIFCSLRSLRPINAINNKQEAQLLVGDHATRKHAKDSWNGRGNDNLGWMTFKCTSRSSKVAPIES